MKKLKLNLDQIKVLSLDMEGPKGRGGTVHAHTYTYDSGIECEPTGIQYSCYSCPGPPMCNVAPWTDYC